MSARSRGSNLTPSSQTGIALYSRPKSPNVSSKSKNSSYRPQSPGGNNNMTKINKTTGNIISTGLSGKVSNKRI